MTLTDDSPRSLEDGGRAMKQALDRLLVAEGFGRARPLGEYRRPALYEMTFDEYLTLIDQALILLRDIYVNRPLKEAVHAARPVRRLELLRLELQRSLPDPIEFHRRMTEIFMSVHDRHVRYFLPASFHHRWAILGIDVEQYFARDERNDVIDEPRYLLTRVVEGFDHAPFGRGVDIVSWNGVPIERAIELNGDRHAGSNEAARHARGLARLAVRPLFMSPMPDEEWVIVGYREEGSTETKFIKLDWWVVTLLPEAAAERHVEDIRLGPPRAAAAVPETLRLGPSQPTASTAVEEIRLMPAAPAPHGGVIEEIRLNPATPARPVAPAHKIQIALDESMDVEADAMRQLRQALLIRKPADGDPKPAGEGQELLHAPTRMPEALLGQRLSSSRHDQHTYYLRIYTFDVDVDAFVEEVVRQVRRVRELEEVRGLILDVRDNGGGKIAAAERLLQLFTPRRVEPERFEFLSTPATLKFCRQIGFLHPWRRSLERAAEIGAVYSQGFPITSPEVCNREDPVFDLPVVLIVNALSYSTTDILAAGFKDHGIGQILAIDNNIGAGGANAASHAELLALAGDTLSLKPLPRGVNMKVAIRRALRVGPETGTPLEELGIEPDARYHMKREDLLEKNRGLIEAATFLFDEPQPFHVEFSRGIVDVAVSEESKVSRIASGVIERSLSTERRVDPEYSDVQINVERPQALRVDGYDEQGLVASRWINLESRPDLRADSFFDLYFFVRAHAARDGAAPPGFEEPVAALRRVARETSDLYGLDWLAVHSGSVIDLLRRLTDERKRDFALTLEAVEERFLENDWPIHRERIVRTIRRLRGEDFLSDLRETLRDEMEFDEDPIFTMPLYLVTDSPTSGPSSYIFGGFFGRRGIAVVSLEQNPGNGLVDALEQGAIQILRRAPTHGRA